MNKTITRQIVAGTVATGSILGVGVSVQAKPFMNVDTESVREFENEYDKAIQAEYEKMSANKAGKEKAQEVIAKVSTEEMKKAHAEETKAMNLDALSDRAAKIYNAPAEVVLLISSSQQTLRGFDKTNVANEELTEAKVYLNEALDLAREYHKVANANRAVDVQRVVKAAELVTDVEKEMKAVACLEKDHNDYVAQQQALIKAENEAKDKTFTALENVRVEMNTTSENRLANLNKLEKLVADALDNVDAFSKLVNSDENVSENLADAELTKAWTEGIQPWFYEKVSTKIQSAIDETNKAISDVKYTGISAYNTGVLSYNTVVKTLQNADSIREVYRDLDEGTESSMLKVISPKSAKTVHYVGGTLETLNPVLKYVNGYVKDKDLEFHSVVNAQQRTASVLSPVTDVINSKLTLAKFKLREAQNAINASKVYVSAKHAVSNAWNTLTGWFS